MIKPISFIKIPIVIFSIGIFLFSCQSSRSEHQAGDHADTLSALDSLTRLIQQDKHNPDLLAQRALLYAEKQKMDSAIDDMLLAVSLDSQNVDYYIRLSQYYLLNAQSEKTKELLEKAIHTKFSKEPKIFIELGKLYLYVKNYEKAKDYLNQALELDPLNANAYYFKAVIAVEEQKPKNAKRFLLAAVERNPDFYEAYTLLGLTAYREHDSLAIDYYKRACEIKPQSIESRYALGMAYQQHNHPAEAVQTYEYILNHLDSLYADAYYNIGYLLLTESSHPEESKSYFEKVIQLDSLRYDAWTNLGILAQRKQNKALAMRYFKKALQLKPNFEPALKNLNALEN